MEGVIFSPPSDVEAVRIAAEAVGKVLGSRTYAIVGGAACALLGSTRTTTDVDIVVPRGQRLATRKLFRDQDGFVVEKGTLHTCFLGNPKVVVEILTPPLLFKESFDDSTPTVQVCSAKVLKPSLLLNVKCHSILGRGELKTRSDAHDIGFLFCWFHEKGDLLRAEECPRVTRAFVTWYIQNFGRENDLKHIGYSDFGWCS